MPERPLPLQQGGDIEDGVDLLLGPFLETDQVTAAQVGLHVRAVYSAAPRMSDSSDIRRTTPLNASAQ